MKIGHHLLSAILLAILNAIVVFAAAEEFDNDQGWKHLSLREKIGQTVIISSNLESEIQAGGGSLKGFFERYPVAGVFLGSWKFEKINAQFRADNMSSLVEQYRAASKFPLFIQEDYEQGPGAALPQYVHLPCLMALGATNSPELARDYGLALARETRSLGINWLLNPVADLNINFMNPVVNSRSVSDNPERAIRLLGPQIDAMQSTGLITTIKHFPGDGMDFRDQHQVTTINSLSMKEWRKTYGKVFGELISQGVASVMIGHIALPAYQKQRPLMPATLSSEIITRLLKQEMRFKGIVISDALNMGGMQSYYPTPLETQIQAFKAGTDLMLWPELAFIDEMEKRINSGDIPMSRLDDAVSRVWAVKKRFGLLDAKHQSTSRYTESEQRETIETARKVAEASITLIRNKTRLVPINAEKIPHLLWVIVTPPEMAAEKMKQFQPTVDTLKSRGFKVDVRVNFSYYENDMRSVEHYERVIFAFDRHTHGPMGTLQLFGTEALTAWSANSLPRHKVISISYGDPYVHDVFLPLAETAINVYSNSQSSQIASVRALTGEIPFHGNSPVNLTQLSKQLNSTMN